MAYPIRLDHYDKKNGNEEFVLGIESVLEYAEHLPVVDAVPVVHGKWEIAIGYDPNKNVQCQNCRLMAYEPTPFCPNCGARMDAEGENT